MLADYVLRGLEAGLVAGLAFGLFVALVGNPLVGLAETSAGVGHHAEAGHGSEPDHQSEAGRHDDGGHHESVVSAAVTEAVSVAAGVVWGVLLGVVTFGLAYYFLEPTLPDSADAGSYLLGAAGFLTTSGAPWLVLPPRPAGVESALPAEARLGWYAAMMAAGAVVCLLAGSAYRRLAPRFGRPAALGGAALALGLLGVPALVAPSATAEGGVSASLAASYRGFVVVGQVGLWVVLAGVHSRLLRRDRASGLASGDRRSAREATPAVSSD